MRLHTAVLAAAGLTLQVASAGSAQGLTPKEQVDALKASLAANTQALHQYEWIETTILRHKGEEKSRSQSRCYYGADGQLERVQLTEPPPEKRRRGLRGRIERKKKEELKEYLKEAVALVKQYVPPDPARLQAAKDDGRLSIQPVPGADKRAKLTFSDYLKPGDSLMLDADFTASRPLSGAVSSFLGSPPEPVTLNVTFATFTDGVTFYPEDVVLDAEAREIQVEVKNGGYRRLNP